MFFAFRSSARESTPPDIDPPRFNFVVLVLAVILLIQGGLFIQIGWEAIATGHYEMSWKSRSSFGGSTGVEMYSGTDAVVTGAGLVSFGVMLLTWASGLVLNFFTSRPEGPMRMFGRLLGWVSFVMFAAGCLCIYPLWKLASMSFHAVILLFLVACPLGRNPGFPRLARVMLPSLIASGIVLGNIAQGIAVGMLLGIFGAVVLMAHLLVLFPNLATRHE